MAELTEKAEAAKQKVAAEKASLKREAEEEAAELTEKVESAATVVAELTASLEKSKDKASTLKGEKKKLETMVS